MDPVDNRRLRFVCWPPSMLGTKTPGSVSRHCSICLQEVWIAQSTVKEIRKRKMKQPIYWCVTCAQRQPEFKNMEWHPPTPEQIEEIEDELRRGRQ